MENSKESDKSMALAILTSAVGSAHLTIDTLKEQIAINLSKHRNPINFNRIFGAIALTLGLSGAFFSLLKKAENTSKLTSPNIDNSCETIKYSNKKSPENANRLDYTKKIELERSFLANSEHSKY